MIDPVAAWLARLALAGVFASAALHKGRDLDAFAAAVAAHRLVPEATVGALARALALCEIAAAVGLLVPASTPLAAGVAGALLALYTGAIAINLARGRRAIDCGCGGPARVPLSGWLVARNALLVAAALACAGGGAARPLAAVDAITIGGGVAVLALLWIAAHGLLASAASFARPAEAA
jgi:uncharacterized membrane protein YphA (DoxX/SURF4 family)